MAKQSQTLRDVLICPICMDIFREPVSTRCQHNFCRQCLQTHAELSRTRSLEHDEDVHVDLSVKCPMCREPLNLCNEGVAGMHLDFKLAEIVEKFHLGEGQHSDASEVCEEHGQQFVIFCITCQVLICNGCINKHNAHRMNDIQTARDAVKSAFVKKVGLAQEVDGRIAANGNLLQGVLNNVQGKRGKHKDELAKAYEKALQNVETWYRDSLLDLDNRYDNWYSECQAAIEQVQAKSKDISRMIKDGKALLSASNVSFMKDVKKLSSGIDELLPAGDQAFIIQEKVSQTLRSALESDPVLPRYVTVKEDDTSEVVIYSAHGKGITTPDLRFTRTSLSNIDIREKCSQIVHISGLGGGSWTDGRLREGTSYWEVAINPNLPDKSVCSCDCLLGVMQEGEESWLLRKTYWGVRLRHFSDVYACIKESVCQQITPAYSRHRAYNHIHRIGCFLDCEMRLFKILDLSHNQLMCVVNHINTTKPLIPVVWLWGAGMQSVSLVPPESLSAHVDYPIYETLYDQ